jgi:hypothetical protein
MQCHKNIFYFIYELFTTLKIISIKVVDLNNINTPMRYVETFSTRLAVFEEINKIRLELQVKLVLHWTNANENKLAQKVVVQTS